MMCMEKHFTVSETKAAFQGHAVNPNTDTFAGERWERGREGERGELNCVPVLG